MGPPRLLLLTALVVGLIGVGAACASSPAVAPAPSAHTVPPPSTTVALLIGPTWSAVVVSQGTAPAGYGLSLSPQTAVQVPGYGSLTLDQARASGGRALVASAVSGLLGVGLDRSSVVHDASPPPLAGGAPYESLPVRPTPADVQAVVTAHLGPVRLTTERAFGRRIELLDASGSAPAARQAALLLGAAGFQTAGQAPAGGAPRAATQIVVYSGAEGSLRVGSDAVDALGVGSVVVSNQAPGPAGQSGVVVDVTVILGADFAASMAGG